MKSLQVLARVLGSGLTIDPVQYSPVNYPFLAYHQYQNPQEKRPKTKHVPQSTKNCQLEHFSKWQKSSSHYPRTLFGNYRGHGVLTSPQDLGV